MIASLLVAMIMPLSHVTPSCCEVSVGSSGLLYYAAYSSAASLSLDLTVRGALIDALDVAGGLRLGLGTVRIEGFARVEIAPQLGAWRPATGIELGVTSRAHYEDGSGIVGELARTSRRELAPVYVAIHALPLRFAIDRCWSIGFLELQLGTNLVPAGRYVRLQLGLITLGVSL